MAFTHDQLITRLERIRLHRELRRHRDELHDRAVFWRLALPGSLMIWAAIAYGIYTLS